MPVVEKIRLVSSSNDFDRQLYEEDEAASKITHLTIWASIESVWQATIQFIQWYNTTKPPTQC